MGRSRHVDKLSMTFGAQTWSGSPWSGSTGVVSSGEERDDMSEMFAGIRRMAERYFVRALSGEWLEEQRDADGNPIHDQLAPRGLQALYRRPIVAASIARHFNRAYYYSLDRTVYDTRWLGVRAVKYPTDMSGSIRN